MKKLLSVISVLLIGAFLALYLSESDPDSPGRPLIPSDREDPGPQAKQTVVSGETDSAITLESAPIDGEKKTQKPTSTRPPTPELGKLPRKEKDVARLGDFDEIEAKRFQHHDGSLRVHRLIKTDMKYPLLRIEEVFSGRSGTLARQEIAVGDHLVVQFEKTISRNEIDATATELGLRVRKFLSHPGLVLLAIPDPDLDSVRDWSSRVAGHPRVVSAEPDYLVFSTP